MPSLPLWDTYPDLGGKVHTNGILHMHCKRCTDGSLVTPPQVHPCEHSVHDNPLSPRRIQFCAYDDKMEQWMRPPVELLSLGRSHP